MSEAPAAAPARTEESYQAFVWQHLRRNYVGHLLHGLLGQTGFRLINAPTFVPAYIHLLSGSDLAVGLARSAQSLGMFLSPILGATTIEHRRRVLPIGFLVGGLMRVQVLGIALAAFFLPPQWALIATWLFLTFFGFFLGMQGVIFNYLMSKVIPVERRGVLLGLRNSLAGVTATAVAGVGGWLVASEALGNGYATTFLVSFGLTSAGLAMLLLVREPEPPEVRSAASFSTRLLELPQLLRSDRHFTAYFGARCLATMGRMAVPFYILYAGDVVGLSGRNLGLLSMAFLLANSTVNLVWGAVADRTGFRLVFAVALVVWIGAVCVLLATESLAVLMVAFFGIGAGFGGFMMSAQNLVLEFGEREDLPMRIAIANSGSELVGAVGPLLGGAIAAISSYGTVFVTAMSFQAAAVVVLLLFVEEPRHRSRA